MDALEKHLLEERLADRFAVENMEQANWALRKVGYHQRKQAEAKALADAEIAKVKAWLDEEVRRGRAGRLLSVWFRRLCCSAQLRSFVSETVQKCHVLSAILPVAVLSSGALFLRQYSANSDQW